MTTHQFKRTMRSNLQVFLCPAPVHPTLSDHTQWEIHPYSCFCIVHLMAGASSNAYRKYLGPAINLVCFPILPLPCLSFPVSLCLGGRDFVPCGGSAKPPTLSSPPGGIPDGEIPCRQFFMLGRKNNKETLIVYIRFLDAVLDRYEDVQGICAHCIYCNK